MWISRRQLLHAAGAAVALPALPGGLCGLGCAPASSASVATSRDVTVIVPAQPTRDGAGVTLKRALGHQRLSMVDPFLMLDEFVSDDPKDYLAGFPDHPHRGFETVTYMLHGAMEHRDSVGNHGLLGPGAAQWMTAGRGVVHSEMPRQQRGLMWGFQLWVNLPAKRKMIPPRYQDVAPELIPERTAERTKVRVIAGRALGAEGPVRHIDVAPTFLDVTLEKGATFTQPVDAAHAAFVYAIDGAVRVGPSQREVRRGELAVLTDGPSFGARCDTEGGRFLLFAGARIGEPVARHGPFVMNTRAELQQAIDDYRSGRLVSGT